MIDFESGIFGEVPKLAAACDRGAIELFEGDWLEPTADLIEGLPQKEQ